MNDFGLDYLKVPVLSASVAYASSLLFYPVEVVATVVKSHIRHMPVKQAVRDIYSERGPISFYKGISTVFYEIFPPSVVYFFMYDTLNFEMSKYFRKNDWGHKWVIPVVTSFVAEASNLALLVPVNTIQTRIKTGQAKYQYKGTFHGLKTISQSEGLLRLYRASHLLLLYSMSFTIIQFSLYEWSKKGIVDYTGNKHFGLKESLVASIVSTTVASITTNPIDTLVTRYQITDFTEKANQRLTAAKLLLRDFKRFGYSGINRGMLVKLCLDNYYSAIYLPAYEFFRQRYHIELEL